jgi:hypothetical protein
MSSSSPGVGLGDSRLRSPSRGRGTTRSCSNVILSILGGPPDGAFDVERRGIPHYFQPHTFLPRGRRLLADWAPDVLDMLVDAGADPQDLALKLHGSRQPPDEDLVCLWVRRPVIEWALRRAAAAEPAVELRAGVRRRSSGGFRCVRRRRQARPVTSCSLACPRLARHREPPPCGNVPSLVQSRSRPLTSWPRPRVRSGPGCVDRCRFWRSGLLVCGVCALAGGPVTSAGRSGVQRRGTGARIRDSSAPPRGSINLRDPLAGSTCLGREGRPPTRRSPRMGATSTHSTPTPGRSSAGRSATMTI